MNELDSITKERCVYDKLTINQINRILYPEKAAPRNFSQRSTKYDLIHDVVYCEEDKRLYNKNEMKLMPASDLLSKTFWSVIWKKHRVLFCRNYSGDIRNCMGNIYDTIQKFECEHLKECYERRKK